MKAFQSSQSGFEGRHLERWRAIAISLLGLSIVGLLALAGCGGGEEESATFSTASAPASGGAPAPMAEEKSTNDATGGAAQPPAAPATVTAQLVQTASVIPRKIIYNATVELVSDNFPTAQQSLLRLVKTHRGYIAETNVGGAAGTPRQGTWKIRIPVTEFDAFMAAVARLGELQTTHTDSQDVTAEYYDLQARISNKQVEEKRLLMHLQRSTAKLSDILRVEQELSRVRGEIEQMQGRLRLLANLTSLTTVSVTIREVKGYVPPKPATFSMQIARTFQASFGQLRDFGKGVVLLVVALAPWLVVLALIGVPAWRIARRQQSRRRETP